MNFTTNGTYRSNHNLVPVRSLGLAEDHLVEFEEMFNCCLEFEWVCGGEDMPLNLPTWKRDK